MAALLCSLLAEALTTFIRTNGISQMRKSWLPAGVTEYKDRHGKARYRFRKAGFEPYHFRSTPGSEEFRVEYAQAQSRPVERVGAASPRPPRHGSFDHCVALWRVTTEFKDLGAATQGVYLKIAQRFCDRTKSGGKRFGDMMVKAVRPRHVKSWLDELHQKPGARENLLKVLRHIFLVARMNEFRPDDPSHGLKAKSKSEGFYTWTDLDIAQFRACHRIGSMARLALELTLNTSARRCDASQLRRSQLIDGSFIVNHAKGSAQAIIPCLAATRVAIDAIDYGGARTNHFVLGAHGGGYTVESFGNKFREWCDEAGLPQCTAHGLRLAMSRMLVEAGATDAQAQAVTGHLSNKVFIRYRRGADRKRLAKAALANLEQSGLANPQK